MQQYSYLKMFRYFSEVGALTVGGAYAMIPVAERVLVEKAGLVSKEELLEAYAVAQTLPGVIVANTSTILGYRKRGFLGALCSLLGVITPSVLIIILVAALFAQVENLELVQKAFSGIRIAVIGMLLKSAYGLSKTSIVGMSYALFFAGALAATFYRVSPVVIILTAAVLGWAISGLRLSEKVKR